MPSKRTNQHVLQHQTGISPKGYNLKNTVPRCRSNQEVEGEVPEEASPVCLQPDRTHQCMSTKRQVTSSNNQSTFRVKAIRWMKQAWQEVDPLTIVKCWSKVSVYCSDEGCEEDDDPFSGEELLTLERFLNQVKDPTNEGPVTVNELIDDHSVPCFQSLIDVHYAEWRTEVRKELLEAPDESDEDATVADVEADDFDPPLCEPRFQSVREALAAADNLAMFAAFNGNEELVQATSKVTTLQNARHLAQADNP